MKRLSGRLAVCVTIVGASLTLPTMASAEGNRVWQADPAEPAAPPAQVLNGQMELFSLNGGVGNTYGSFCCSSGHGFVVIGGSARTGSGAQGDVAFRRARDASFGLSFGGVARDRAFRMRANRIQRSGF